MSEKNELAQVLELENMLDYQENSVGSRTFIKKDVGIVTLESTCVHE